MVYGCFNVIVFNKCLGHCKTLSLENTIMIADFAPDSYYSYDMDLLFHKVSSKYV